jgi:hypothetical protein
LHFAEIQFNAADRHFALGGVLNAIQRIRKRLDGYIVKAAECVLGAVQHGVKDRAEVFEFGARHRVTAFTSLLMLPDAARFKIIPRKFD